MVDEETYKKFLATEIRARTFCLSLVEALDREGLLLTNARRHYIEADILERLYRRLDLQPNNKLMSFRHNRLDGTAAEGIEAVKEWIATIVRSHGNNTLEDF